MKNYIIALLIVIVLALSSFIYKSKQANIYERFPFELKAIGWVIPGLLANNLEKQKYIPTLASLFTVAVITYFLTRLLFWAGL